MPITIVALSGPICSGKTNLAHLLVDRAGAILLKTNEILQEFKPSNKTSRTSLQRLGDRLDRETNGRWIVDGLIKRLSNIDHQSNTLVVIDSIRIEPQLNELRKVYTVVHVHLEADDSELANRYAHRKSTFRELSQYTDVRKNKTEKLIKRLSNTADVVIETDRCTPEDVYVRVAARLGLRFPLRRACVDVLIGGQYGSEGKGNIVHYLSSEYDVLVRVGGPNAGHKVFRPDDDPFTFHQLPSGALANPDAKLVLGAGAVINLERLLKEIAALSIPYTRLAIDGQAMIIEQADIDWEKKFLKDDIASTAQGVGAATARKINGRRLESDVRLARDIPVLERYIQNTVDVLAEAVSKNQRILLEGTQGTSLSIHHGYYPHVTSRVTTASGCLAEAGIAPHQVRRVIMVCRTYPIRVGDTDTGNTSGHMEQPIDLQTVAKRSGLDLGKLEKVERTSTTNRDRRIAEFDWAQFRRSLILNAPTDIALTFADYIDAKNEAAYRYEQLTEPTLRFVEELEKISGIPVSLISTRFGLRNIIDRRAWE